MLKQLVNMVNILSSITNWELYIDNPYLISILTREGDNEELNETINAKVRNIQLSYFMLIEILFVASMYD